MGKTKQKNKTNKSGAKQQVLANMRAKKDLSVFKVAGAKVTKNKNQPKPVTTSLKKLENKSQRDARTQKVDATLDDIRAKMMNTKKDTVILTGNPMAVEKHRSDVYAAAPDMEAATSEFAKL